MDTKGRFMKTYDDEYYIVFDVYDDNTLYLTALQKSADRDPGHAWLTPGQEPLFFENSYKDDDIKDGKSRAILNAHMNMNSVLMSVEIREKIKDFNIDSVQIYPAVIIDDAGKYYDEYWYVNVFKRLDCLDYERCKIKKYKPDADSHRVKKYCLSTSVLDGIPEESRLIFKPEKTSQGYTFFHKKIVKIFKDAGVNNLNFFKVSEYEMGDEY